MIEEWITSNAELFYILIEMGIAFILGIILKIVYILRTTPKTTRSSDLKQVKSVIENNTILKIPKYKLIKDIEVIDLDDENDKETDTSGNSE